jgi:hypothetical protein
VSNFTFKFNSCRYIEEDEALTFPCTATCGTAVAPGEESTPCHKLRKYKGPK